MNTSHQTPSTTGRLVDRFGRVHDVLRLSLTARCNLRCRYCMPDMNQRFPARSEELGAEELVFAVRVAADLGVTRVRLTGGEPLLKRGIVDIVREIERVEGIDDIALTTNGVLLERFAGSLADAGLDRLNVSIDSLDPERFAHITQTGKLDAVMRGVSAAREAGLGPIKINVLAIDGFNDDEASAWLDLIRDQELCVRFLEVMPIGEQAIDGLGAPTNLTALRQRWQREYGLAPAPHAHHGNGPAEYWAPPGARGCVGFITPSSRPYCGACRRLRLTSQGRLYSCLANEAHVNLREALRRHDHGAVRAGFEWSVQQKKEGHRWNEGARTSSSMFALGG